MKSSYDKYYQTADLFGEPYPELIELFKGFAQQGTLLDLGCGQGRDAVPLARLGFTVTGIDNSKVGIEQMNQIAAAQNLSLEGLVADIFAFDRFADFDFILLDSMFHFAKKDRKKETDLIKTLLNQAKTESIVVFCIQDQTKKIDILNETIAQVENLERLVDQKYLYTFSDQESDHESVSDYRMIAIKKG